MKRIIAVILLSFLFLQSMIAQNDLYRSVSTASFRATASAPDVPAGPYYGTMNPGTSSQNADGGIWFGHSSLSANFSTIYTDGSGSPEKLPSVTRTWLGNTSDWGTPANWSGGQVPSSADAVVIPDASTTDFDPILPASTSINTMTIQSGGVLEGGTGTTLTITGASGAWNNSGNFDAASSTIIFTNSAATMTGSTNFFNVTISSGAALTLGTNNLMRISGLLRNDGTLHAAANNNTVEYNGADQSVINPNGTIPGYYHLILSGSGASVIKTMPTTPLSVAGNFSTAGSLANVNTRASISIGGNVVLGSGTTFNGNTFTHNVAGNWTNNGATFSFSVGGTCTLNFNGTALQTITKTVGAFRVNNLNINNTGPGVVLGPSTNCQIAGYLVISSGALFDLAANQLTQLDGSILNSGTIRTINTSSTPVVTDKDWGGTFEYAGSSAQTAVKGTYNNLTISGTGGVTATDNITVNGILNLAASNPSATKGLIDMVGASTSLTMGESATTTGPGDLTGIVTVKNALSNPLAPNTTYTLGNEFTSITFPNVGTLPSSISLKISIGAAPSWHTTAVERIYDFIQSGGTGTKAVLNLHYLPGELNGRTENRLVDWSYQSPGPANLLGRSDFNLSNHWVALANVDVSTFGSSYGFDDLFMALDESGDSPLTWNGSVSTDWNTANNWTPNQVPNSSTSVIIPDASTTPNDPYLPASTTCLSVTIENAGILRAVSGAQLELAGAGSAWSNQGGTFYAGNSTVSFSNANATINGTTNFFNLTILGGAGLTMTTNSMTQISGTFTNGGTLNAALSSNAIEYNGGSQTVLNPNGAITGYFDLILSGGTKTLPSSEMFIYGDLTTNANINAGTGTVVMNGSAQLISGTNAPTFYNLFVTNINTVTLDVNTIVNNLFTVSSGSMVLNATRNLTVNGTTDFESSESLILSSDATGTASFIDNGTITGSGTVTVQRYLTNAGSGSEWHQVSSPISNGLTGIFLTEYLTQYYEPSHKSSYIIPTYLTLAPMKGYDVWVNSTDTKSFTGALNTGSQSFNVTRTYMDSVSAYDGWNLIGNPYPSGLDVSMLTYTGVEASAYFWNPTGTGNFVAWVSGGGGFHSQYAPPMQGFYVHCNNSVIPSPGQNTGSVGFSNAARTHTLVEPFWKETEILSDLLRIKATGTLNGYSDELSVYFNPERNDTYEPGFDAYKMQGNADAPQIYTKIQDQRVTVNALAFTGRNASVPMGFYINTAGQYLLHASEIESFPQNVSISLEDLKLGTTQDLRTSADYSFTYTPGDNSDRFVLHFVNPTFGIDEVQNSVPVKIYSSEGIVYVQQLDGKTLAGEIYLYDMLGREAMQMHVDKEGTTSFKPVVTKGTYLVKVVTSDGVYTKKVNL